MVKQKRVGGRQKLFIFGFFFLLLLLHGHSVALVTALHVHIHLFWLFRFYLIVGDMFRCFFFVFKSIFWFHFSFSFRYEERKKKQTVLHAPNVGGIGLVFSFFRVYVTIGWCAPIHQVNQFNGWFMLPIANRIK